LGSDKKKKKSTEKEKKEKTSLETVPVSERGFMEGVVERLPGN